jgi:hypothetical protein
MTQNKMIWLGSGKYQERKTGKKLKRKSGTPWCRILPETLTGPH